MSLGIPPERSTKKKLGFIRFLSIWAYLSIAAGAWALATPLAASPDEPAHIIKAAAVSQGEFVGEQTDQAAVTLVRVPESIATASSWPCFAFQSNVSAGCMPESPSGTALAEATTSAGLYNPMYYALVGWPTRFVEDGATAVYLMRVISAIIVSLFLTFTWFAIKALSGPIIGGITFLALATPMVFFLTGVVNPNALEVASSAALISSLLLTVRNNTRFPNRTIWLAAIAASGVVLANSRGISPFWLLLMFGLAVLSVPLGQLLVQLKDSRFIATMAIVLVGVIASALWVLSSGTLTSMGTFPGAGQVSPLHAFMTMVVQKTVDPGLIGVFGWLDTFAPPVVYAIWSILIGGIVFAALVLARGRSLIAVWVALTCFVAGPALIQAISVQKSGFIWQGRYSLAIMAALLIVAGLAVADSSPKIIPQRLSLRIVTLVGIAFVVGQLSAFISALGRYVTGNSGAIFAALGAGEWNPPLGAKLWAALATIAFIALVAHWIFTVRKVVGPAVTGSPEYQAVER